VEGRPEVFDFFPLDFALFLPLLHLDLANADFYFRVVLDGAARLHQEDVDAPVLHVVPGHDGADAGVQVEVSRAVGVEDGGEAGPVAVEEVLGGNEVPGAAVLKPGLEPVAVAEDLFGGGGVDQPVQTRVLRPILQNFLRPPFLNVRYKLGRLSLAAFSFFCWQGQSH
jgi:hypothetical protein